MVVCLVVLLVATELGEVSTERVSLSDLLLLGPRGLGLDLGDLFESAISALQVGRLPLAGQPLAF